MLDGCQYDEDIESIQRMLTRNFLRHYTDSNKAPFPMYEHLNSILNFSTNNLVQVLSCCLVFREASQRRSSVQIY